MVDEQIRPASLKTTEPHLNKVRSEPDVVEAETSEEPLGLFRPDSTEVATTEDLDTIVVSSSSVNWGSHSPNSTGVSDSQDEGTFSVNARNVSERGLARQTSVPEVSSPSQPESLSWDSSIELLENGFDQTDSSVARSNNCVVCGEAADGNFFGAVVCLPCKSFFIRCTKDGEPCIPQQCCGSCDIKKQLRNRCQYCRYQKCLAVGMSRKEKPEYIHPQDGQELCKVCGDIANGIHFGIYTCEGCKKFFRRGLKEYTGYVCKQDKNCALNPRNRNNCRFCRYQKCLFVGMSREAIKMGRPRKLYPIRNGSQLRSGHDSSATGTGTESETFSNNSSNASSHAEGDLTSSCAVNELLLGQHLGESEVYLPQAFFPDDVVAVNSLYTQQAQTSLGLQQEGRRQQQLQHQQQQRCILQGQMQQQQFYKKRLSSDPSPPRKRFHGQGDLNYVRPELVCPQSRVTVPFRGRIQSRPSLIHYREIHESKASGQPYANCIKADHHWELVPSFVYHQHNRSDNLDDVIFSQSLGARGSVVLPERLREYGGHIAIAPAENVADTWSSVTSRGATNGEHSSREFQRGDSRCVFKIDFGKARSSFEKDGLLVHQAQNFDNEVNVFRRLPPPITNRNDFLRSTNVNARGNGMPPLIQIRKHALQADCSNSYIAPNGVHCSQAFSETNGTIVSSNGFLRSQVSRVHGAREKRCITVNDSENGPISNNIAHCEALDLRTNSRSTSSHSNNSSPTPDRSETVSHKISPDFLLKRKSDVFQQEYDDATEVKPSKTSKYKRMTSLTEEGILCCKNGTSEMRISTEDGAHNRPEEVDVNATVPERTVSVPLTEFHTHSQCQNGSAQILNIPRAAKQSENEGGELNLGGHSKSRQPSTSSAEFNAGKASSKDTFYSIRGEKIDAFSNCGQRSKGQTSSSSAAKLMVLSPPHLCQKTCSTVGEIEETVPRRESPPRPSYSAPKSPKPIKSPSQTSVTPESSTSPPSADTTNLLASETGGVMNGSNLVSFDTGISANSSCFSCEHAQGSADRDSPQDELAGLKKFDPYTDEQTLVCINEMFLLVDTLTDNIASSSELDALDGMFSNVYGYSPRKVSQYWKTLYSCTPGVSPRRCDVMLAPENVAWLDSIRKLYMEQLEACDEDANPPSVNTNSVETWPVRGKDADHWLHFQERVARQAYAKAQFMLKLPGMGSINSKDRVKLGSSARLFGNTILMASREWFDPVRKKFKFFWNWKLPQEHPLAPFRNRIIKTGSRIFNLHMDRTEVSILSALNIMSSEAMSFHSMSQVAEQTQLLMNLLCFHLHTINVDADDRVPELLSVMPRVRHMSIWYSNLIRNMKADPTSMDKTIQDLAQLAAKVSTGQRGEEGQEEGEGGEDGGGEERERGDEDGGEERGGDGDEDGGGERERGGDGDEDGGEERERGGDGGEVEGDGGDRSKDEDEGEERKRGGDRSENGGRKERERGGDGEREERDNDTISVIDDADGGQVLEGEEKKGEINRSLFYSINS